MTITFWIAFSDSVLSAQAPYRFEEYPNACNLESDGQCIDRIPSDLIVIGGNIGLWFAESSCKFWLLL